MGKERLKNFKNGPKVSFTTFLDSHLVSFLDCCLWFLLVKVFAVATNASIEPYETFLLRNYEYEQRHHQMYDGEVRQNEQINDGTSSDWSLTRPTFRFGLRPVHRYEEPLALTANSQVLFFGSVHVF